MCVPSGPLESRVISPEPLGLDTTYLSFSGIPTPWGRVKNYPRRGGETDANRAPYKPMNSTWGGGVPVKKAEAGGVCGHGILGGRGISVCAWRKQSVRGVLVAYPC